MFCFIIKVIEYVNKTLANWEVIIKHSLSSNKLLHKIGIRSYSSQPNSGAKAGLGVEVATDLTSKEVNPGRTKEIKTLASAGSEKYYDNLFSMKNQIMKENKNKAGIYKFTNKLSGSFYIGSSNNLRIRIYSYFRLSNLIRSSKSSIIARALIKYGYSNFSLEILEYCDVSNLLEREQFYFDLLKPNYNIAKIAGSTLGIPRTEEFKQILSAAQKGRVHTEETKVLMSMHKTGINNPMFGKKHTDQTKNLMKLSSLGRVADVQTKKLMSATRGTPVYLYALCTGCGMVKYCLVKQFLSFREAGKYLNISHSNISRYVKSGNLISRIDGQYKLTFSLLEN